MKNKILILGALGMLGHELFQIYSSFEKVHEGFTSTINFGIEKITDQYFSFL